MKVETSVSFLDYILISPIIGSSGCVGYGSDFNQLNKSHCYGGMVLKTITLEPKLGNSSPRVCETNCGFINAIGLQNPGFKKFKEIYYPKLKKLPGIKIASIAAFDLKGYLNLQSKINRLDDIDLIELNLSCPNLDRDKKIFATDEKLLKKLVAQSVKKKVKPIIIKLSPNVTSIATMAKIVEEEGGDAINIANTFWGMKINTQKREPMIANIIGGYSGPAIKPIVTALIYQARKAVKIPIIATGGVMDGEDVVEYLLAGANLVGVGTANIIDVKKSQYIYRGLVKYLKQHKLKVVDLIGGMI